MERRRLTKGLRANKPTEEVEERGTGWVEVHVPRDKLAEGAEARNKKSRRNLKLTLRGSVEKQDQHEPNPICERSRGDEPGSAGEAGEPNRWKAGSVGSQKAVRGLRS